MRKFDSPYIADWFAISLRWMTLFALTVALGKDRELISLLPLFVLALGNLAWSVMAGLNIRLTYHRQLAILVDIIFAILIFLLEKGLTGAVAWIGILPILSGAIYFEILGGVLAASVMAVTALAFSYFGMSAGSLPAGAIAAVITLALGLYLAF
jgi:hypothetical protein